MKKYIGNCILLLGLIAAAGANDVGQGYFTASALIGIGTTLNLRTSIHAFADEKK